MDFELAVLEFPETKVAGIKTETDMKNAQNDCAALWESFNPILYGELSVNKSVPEMPATYGIWKILDNQRFNYWAAVDIESEKGLPDTLEILTIPMAMYATCQVPDIDQLKKAWKVIYEEWPPTQIDYAIDKNNLSFERYPYMWKKEGLFEIYVPVTMIEPN